MSFSICYDETFPQKVREGRKLGAKLLVNVTNDGWYPFSRLPSQHFEHAKFRAIENGAPLIRACNTGVSASVDSLGRTVACLKEKNSKNLLYAKALFSEVETYTYSTLYTFWGDWGMVSLCLLFLGNFLSLKREYYW